MKRALLSILPLLVIVSCNSPGTTYVSNTHEVQPTATTTAQNVHDTIDLKVTVLPTVDGIQDETEVKKFKYPATISVNDADGLSNQIAAYGAAYKVWLGPKGWTGNGASGADGSLTVDLYPTGGSAIAGPHISYSEIPACQGCIAAAAAPYFPAAADDYNKNYTEGYLAAAERPAGIQITTVSPTLITYTLPVKNGLITRGAVYYFPPDSGDAYFADAKFVLPEDQSKLADVLMRLYTGERK